MKVLLMLLLCLWPGLVQAGTVYRCVGPAGQVSYLGAPCPNSLRTDRHIEFVAVPDSLPLAIAPDPSNVRRRASRSAASPRARATKRRPTQSSRCAMAKARRELQLQRLRLKRTFDDLSRIDAAVRVVCNGF